MYENPAFLFYTHGLTTGEDHAVVVIGGDDEFGGVDGAVQA